MTKKITERRVKGSELSWEEVDDNFVNIAGMFSGPTQPANPIPFMMWADTTAQVVKQRNKDNNAWLSLFDFNGTYVNDIQGVGSYLTPSNTVSLSNKSIDGGANTLTNIPNSALINSSITVNGTKFNLGDSKSIAVGDVTTTGAQTLTNKTIGGLPADGNNINAGAITSGTIDSNRLQLKTINNQDIRGTGNIAISGGGGGDVTMTGVQTLSNKTLDSSNSIDASAIKSGTIDAARLPTINATLRGQTFTTSQNWTVPAGVTSVFAIVIGGGGAGGGAYTNGAGPSGGASSFGAITALGGSGGAPSSGAGASVAYDGTDGGIKCAVVSVSPGQVISVVVGTGGISSVVGNNYGVGGYGYITPVDGMGGRNPQSGGSGVVSILY